MIEVKIEQRHIDKAKELAKEMGTLRNSITSGQGNLAGFIGEVVLAEVLDAKQANTYDSDLLFDDGKTIDVKTKRTRCKPLDYYECSIAAYNTKQRCNYYAFCRVNNDMDTLWFLGLVEKGRYFEMSRYLKKGAQDGDNGFVVKADCYNITIKDLWKEFKALLDRSIEAGA